MKSNDKTPPAAGQAAHTPTPWRSDGEDYVHGFSDAGPLRHAVIRSAGERWAALVEVEDAEGHANAAFIVRACNESARLHADKAGLSAALAETVRSLEWVISAFPDIPANCNFSDVLSEARAALQAAKGEA